jgi:required for meiotic nuclear division protein 1
MVLSMSAIVVRRQLLSPLRWRSNTDNLLKPSRFLHATSAAQLPRKRHFFSSNAMLQQEESKSDLEITETPSQIQKRKAIRSPPGKRSLRRVAVEAQRSREDNIRRKEHETESIDSGNLVTAICVAEELDMSVVVRILRSHGFPIDPYGTGFPDEQVVHTRGVNDGDIFVFPSGTVVAWSLPEDVAITLATQTLKPATINPYVDQLLEVEDLEFKEDPTRENSSIKGDVITLGTKMESEGANESR